ncbi:MAG: Calx-beta domain-containing protein [Bacillota bacterium]
MFQGESAGFIDPTQKNNITLGYRPGQLSTGDVNGDGSPDFMAVPYNNESSNSSKTFTVTILDDSDMEEDETVNLALSNPQGGILGSQSMAVLTITDRPWVVFENAEYDAWEGSTLNVTVKRGGGGDRLDAGAVQYTVQDLTARAGADYTLSAGTIQFGAGETEKILSIPILVDQAEDDLEQFRLTLQNPTGDAIQGSQATTVITINDKNKVQFSQAGYSVNEAAGSVTITVIRTGGTEGRVTVNYNTYGDWGTGGLSREFLAIPMAMIRVPISIGVTAPLPLNPGKPSRALPL